MSVPYYELFIRKLIQGKCIIDIAYYIRKTSNNVRISQVEFQCHDLIKLTYKVKEDATMSYSEFKLSYRISLDMVYLFLSK